MKRFVLVALLGLMGCATSPIPSVPPPPSVYPITITPGQLNKPVMIQLLSPAPKKFNVSCCLPLGVTVENKSGALWLSGTPRQAGQFRFRITP